MSEPLDVIPQVVPVHLDLGFLVGQLVHLPPELAHLVLVQVSDAGLPLPPQLLELRHQNLVLLFQIAHLVDVAGEPVVEVLHLRLLVGPVGFELRVDGIREGEVHVVGGETEHRRAAAVADRLGGVDARGSGGDAVGCPRGTHRAGVLAARVSGPSHPGTFPSEHPGVGRGRWLAGACPAAHHLAFKSLGPSNMLFLEYEVLFFPSQTLLGAITPLVNTPPLIQRELRSGPNLAL